MTRARVLALRGMLITAPACGISKFWGTLWLREHGAGSFYVMFWIFAAFFVWPRQSAVKSIAISVFLGTCFLEFLQLWHPPFLEMIRSTFVGRALIGTTFEWLDFPPYALGALLGWGWIRLVGPGASSSDPQSRPLSDA